jgi:hypothetical protein
MPKVLVTHAKRQRGKIIPISYELVETENQCEDLERVIAEIFLDKMKRDGFMEKPNNQSEVSGNVTK